MQVGVGISGEIVVDSEVDALDINTTTKDVGGNANALVELLEFLVTTNTIIKSAIQFQRPAIECWKHTAPPG